MNIPNFGYDRLFFFSILFLLISLCVIFHEYGHALAAKFYGIKTDDIILSPLFGVARLQKLPDTPIGEFIVAVAGPAVNFLLGILFFIYLQIVNPDFLSVFSHELYYSFFQEGKRVANLPEGFSKINLSIAILIFVNLGLVLFNLIPAFPMDGGRMFRAFLNSFMDKLSATKFATILGKAISIVIFFISIYYEQYGMALVAMFIFYMAAGEYKVAQNEAFRNQFQLGQIMRTSFIKLNQFSTRKEVNDLLFHSFENDFLVFDSDEKLKGILLKENIIKWISNKSISYENEINNYLINNYSILNIEDKIDSTLDVMNSLNLYFLPIQHEGKIIGVVTRKNIYEFIDVQYQLIKQN